MPVPGGPGMVTSSYVGNTGAPNASANTAVPRKLKIEFLAADGATVVPYPLVRVERDQKDASHTLYVENCKFRIAAVRPDGSRDTAARGTVRLVEVSNALLAPNHTFSYMGESFGTASALGHYRVPKPTDPFRDFSHLALGSGGRTEAQTLRSLAGPRFSHDGSTVEANWDALLRAQSAVTGLSQGFEDSDQTEVGQWVDQVRYKLEEGASQATFDVGGNGGIPGWFEAEFWDTVAKMRQSADQLSSVVGSKVTGLDVPAVNNPICPPPDSLFFVCPFESTVRINPTQPWYENDRVDGPASGIYHGLSWSAPHDITSTVWHEARHCWQYQQEDSDHDGIPDAVLDPEASPAILDSMNVARAGGVNPEFDFRGPIYPDLGVVGSDPDGLALQSDAVERDAMRWEMRKVATVLQGAAGCFESLTPTRRTSSVPIYDLEPVSGVGSGGKLVPELFRIVVRDTESKALTGVKIFVQVETSAIPAPGETDPGNGSARVIDRGSQQNSETTNALGLTGVGGLSVSV